MKETIPSYLALLYIVDVFLCGLSIDVSEGAKDFVRILALLLSVAIIAIVY